MRCSAWILVGGMVLIAAGVWLVVGQELSWGDFVAAVGIAIGVGARWWGITRKDDECVESTPPSQRTQRLEPTLWWSDEMSCDKADWPCERCADGT